MPVTLSIIGAGVSGAYLAYLLASNDNLDVRVYDYDPYYGKPCGEVVPARIFTDLKSDAKKFLPQYITRSIKSFEISVNGRKIASVKSTKDLWYVINKRKLVLDLRKKAVDRGVHLAYKYITSYRDIKYSSIIVDARGPFTDSLNPKIPVYNAILECSKNTDTVYLYLDTRTTGFAWVFPYHKPNTINIGGGYLKSPHNLRNYIFSLLAENIRDCKLVEEKGSLILLPLNRIEYTSTNSDKLIIRVGEALGLVYPTTGEGIRPSMYSAECLARVLRQHYDNKSRVLAVYKRCLRRLVSNIRLHTLLLKWSNKLGDLGLFRRVSQDFIYDYLSANLSYKSIILELGRLVARSIRFK